MRNLSPAVMSATSDPVVRPILLCRLDFELAPTLVHSGVGTINYGGEDYLGLGSYGGVSSVTEGSDARPYDIDLSLSGIPTEFLATTMGEQYQGRGVVLSVGLLDADLQIIDTVKQVWSGYMDYPDIVLGESATIVVHCRGRANDWAKPRLTRYTKEWLRAIYPDDSGLDYVAQMEDKSIHWGVA